MLMGVVLVWRYHLAWWLAITRRHNSVKVEGDIWTLSPLVVVEGPAFVVGGLILRMAYRPPPSLF